MTSLVFIVSMGIITVTLAAAAAAPSTKLTWGKSVCRHSIIVAVNHSDMVNKRVNK